MGAKCPVSQRYTLRLNRLHEEFSSQGVTILGISSNKNESLKELIRYAYDTGYKIQLVKDTDGAIARQIGATMTPQVFVVDQQSILRYRGAIDDDRYENRVKNRYLRDVLNAFEVNKPRRAHFVCGIVTKTNGFRRIVGIARVSCRIIKACVDPDLSAFRQEKQFFVIINILPVEIPILDPDKRYFFFIRQHCCDFHLASKKMR